MCRPANCKTCGKATYKGCGLHVEEVLAGVPDNERCDCAADGANNGGGWFRRNR